MSTNNSEQKADIPKGHDSHQSLIKSTSILSVGTLSSRILGFIRDVLLARLFGTGLNADAFFAAFRIPNLFRDFLGEGAVNSALVPVFSEYLEKKEKKELWELINVVFLSGLIILSIITILGILLSPVIVRVLVPGFIANPDKLFLTIRLTKIMFPYLILIGLASYAIGVLYVFRSFVSPAFAPCAFNVALITGAMIASRGSKEPVLIIAISVLIGGILQVLVQLRPLLKTGFRFKMPATLKHDGSKKIGRLLFPRLFGTAVYHSTIIIDTFCASLSGIVGVGGISAVYFSNRLIQVPMGLFGFPISAAALPILSNLAVKKDLEQFKKTLMFSLENIFFVVCPILIIFLFFSKDIIQILFQRGKFDEYSTNITSSALLFYSIGLFSYSGVKLLVSAFYALQDTKTPVKVAAISLIINAVLNFALMFPMKIAGIAFASSIAQTVNLFLLLIIIHKKIGGIKIYNKGFFLKVSLSGFISGYLMLAINNHLVFMNPILRLFIVIAAGAIVYLLSCLLQRVEKVKKIFEHGINLFRR